ncbi:magnesium transporter CorA family protein [Alloiococcus sp. CFN-8]|uniref:magnesium transporter CorA family protein n=1 Tax=Alloiococcus sp. CFN-8 TaxID=3416081 RepID=UPI003CF1654E
MIRYTYSYKAVKKIITTDYMERKNFLEEIEDIDYNLLWVDIHIEKGEAFDDYMEVIEKFFNYKNPDPLREIRGRRSIVEKNTEFYTIDMAILKEGSLGKNIKWMKEYFIINKKVIISLSYGRSQVLDAIWDHIPSNAAAFREEADTLLYVILDSICDEYFVSLEDLEELVDNIEGVLIKDSSSELQTRILELRRKILKFKRVVTSLRTVTYSLISYDYDFIKPPTIKLIQTIYDNTYKIYEALDAYTDTLATDLSIYETKISNKMNKTMEFFTVITTIMAPLTLIAGIYGMNFKYMPELDNRSAYPLTMLFMFILIVIQIIYFKKKKWL